MKIFDPSNVTGSDAYKRGFEACKNGKSVWTDNPFEDQTTESEHWTAGYHQAALNEMVGGVEASADVSTVSRPSEREIIAALVEAATDAAEISEAVAEELFEFKHSARAASLNGSVKRLRVALKLARG